ncbi:hypothetical protein [Secundilactobacillus collinoides]|uniref:hypothetical protein n=1 Tax=Secundilactobacillus collinoides TaxID=33960 RepID=UPI0007AE8962|nr:hypothetical protein [Secundilactobacillus collinoides]
MQTHPLISAVGCQIEEYDPKIGKTRNKNVPITSAKIYRYAKKRNPLNHMSVMFRKKDILAVNGYEQVSLFEDYYLWVKLLKRGYKLYNLPMNLIRATTDSGFYSRRGGFGYFKREYRFQLLAYSLSFTSKYEFLRNVLVRTCMRLFPPNALQFIYEKILRNNN